MFTLGIYLVFIFYPIMRLLSWIEEIPSWSLFLLGVIQFLPYILAASRFVFRVRLPFSRSKWVLFWIGFSYLLFPVVILLELGGWLLNINSDDLALIGVTFAIFAGGYAILNAHTLTVKRIEVNGPPELSGQSLVQLTDVHIGSRKTSFLRRVVEKVQSLDPDYVVITGDLVDSHTVTKSDLSALSDISAPKFFTIGNHERYEDCEQIVDWMRALGFNVLRTESYFDGPIQFTGIDDTESPERLRTDIEKVELKNDLYQILFYHRPSEYEFASSKGFNLMISGHTHAGQIFPFNFVVKRYFKITKGTHRIGNMILHVSTGTGTWGPTLRFGSNNEVSQFVFV